jgi:tRNA(Ile2) C34 agmatinyltransferase TiaS
MNSGKKLAAITALVAALAAPSLFADNRRQETTDGWRGRSNESRRVTIEGRIRDIDRDRNEFVIRLDRGGYVLVADAQTRVEAASNRRGRSNVRQLERGDDIRAVGTVDRGRLYVDRISLVREEDDRGGRDDRSLTGVVTQVDRRGNVVWVELERAGRVVAVDVRRVDRNSRRYDVDDLRRGDRITVRGDWQRNGRFEAERLDVDRGGGSRR